MQNRLILAIVCLSVMVAGCSSSGKIEDYQRASGIKPIEFPDSVEPVPLEPLYPIPGVRIREEAFYNSDVDGFQVPRPEPLSAERERAKIKIQKVGDRRWILAEAPSSQVWPLTQNFLMQYDMGARASVPGTGLVETEWVVFNDDPNRRHQFRLNIEQGVRAETTEVHILQRAFSKDKKVSDQEPWPESSMDPSREEWVLAELANFLAGSIDNRAASLLGQEVGGDVKAVLQVLEDEPVLRLHLDMQRAWATVAHALNQEGFTLWDEDSEQKVFFVQHEDFAPQRNWFTRLLFGESEAERTKPYPLAEAMGQLADNTATRTLFAEKKGVSFTSSAKNGYGFLVVLKKRDDDVLVKVRDYRGRLLPLRDNKKLLLIIRRNLI